MYDKLFAKVSNIDISGIVLETTYDKDRSELGNKIPDTSGLAKNTNYNANIIDIENKIPSVSGLATNAALTAVENKMPDISSSVNKTDYNAEINEIEKKVTNHNLDKYITTPEFNKFTAEIFATRLAQIPILIIN